MVFQNFDIFSSQFQFNVGQKVRQKSTFIGGILSFLAIMFSLLYFFYLIFLYAENRIEPKYKMQNFIQDGEVSLNPEVDSYGFNFFLSGNKTLDMLEKESGLKYLVYFPTFQVYSKTDLKYINLTVVDCKDSYLQGMKCFDFSALKNYQITIDGRKQLYYEIIFLIYKCTDVDGLFKLDVPSNCASDEMIDELINDRTHYMQFLFKTQQFNTTSQDIEVRYKQYYSHLKSDEMLLSVIKNVKQVTNIKRGPIFQNTYSFSSPIDYIKEERSFNKINMYKQTGINLLSQITITLDESVQQIQIQYATFMEILAIFNSTFTFVIGIGMVGKYYSRKLIQQDIMLVVLKEMFPKTYIKWLNYSSIFNLQKTIKNTNLKQSFNQSINQKPSIISDKISINSNQKLIIDQQPGALKQKKQQQKTIDIMDLSASNSDIEIKLDKSLPKVSKNFFFISQLKLNHNRITSDKSQIRSKQKDLTQKMAKQPNSPDSSSQSNHCSQLNLSQSKDLIVKNQDKDINKVLINDKNVAKQINGRYDDYLSAHKQYDKITNVSDLIQVFKALNNSHFSNKISSIFSNLRCRKKKIQKEQIKEFEKEYNILQSEALKQVNIIHLFKELISLKKAVMVLLSKEQYAALNFIGCRIAKSQQEYNLEEKKEIKCVQQDNNTIQQDLTVINSYQTSQKQKQNNFQMPMTNNRDTSLGNNIELLNITSNTQYYKSQNKIKNIQLQNDFELFNIQESHLDSMIEISNQEQKQLEYMQQFLKNNETKQCLSEIDKRILSSLIL